ncbi:MAG: hypothetical protein L3J74_09615 [Bacteroidales bacterium]|nr:hypothetical protein [Bacteroidales bacterium]
MKFITYGLLFIILFITQSNFRLLKKIDKKTDFIALDNLGFLYLYENNNLYKYSATGDLINRSTELSYGKLSVFDASDPYMLLLYYQDLNRIVFLDNQLAQIGNPIDLDKLELFQVDKVCKSKEFAIWIYDDFDKRLIQYGFNPRGILNEINLSLLNIPGKVNFMRESGNYLYLSTFNQLYVFDIYGTLIKKININIPNSFELINNKIIYSKGHQLFVYSIDENRADTLSINFTQNIKHILLNNKFLYLQKKDRVLVFEKK